MRKNLVALMMLGGVLVAPASFAADGEALYKSKACVACHSIDQKLVGPAFKDVAAKYADQADAVPYLVGRITKGSQNVWGPIPMPPNAVSEEEAKTLAEWVLSHK